MPRAFTGCHKQRRFLMSHSIPFQLDVPYLEFLRFPLQNYTPYPNSVIGIQPVGDIGYLA